MGPIDLLFLALQGLTTSAVTAPSGSNVFKKRLEQVWTEACPHLPVIYPSLIEWSPPQPLARPL